MLNRAILIGNVGGDPDIRNLPNGDRVANFSLATSEKWKDKDGNRQERTEWHRITIWNEGLIKVVENYVKKGSRIYIEGQLQTRKWQDKDGHDRYTTEIVLKPYRGEIKLLDAKGDDEGTSRQSGGGQSGGHSTQSGSNNYATASGGSSAYNQTARASHQRLADDDEYVPF